LTTLEGITPKLSVSWIQDCILQNFKNKVLTLEKKFDLDQTESGNQHPDLDSHVQQLLNSFSSALIYLISFSSEPFQIN